MADDWDRQRDIAAEGQRAALYYQNKDTAEIVRRRLADGRTIADHDVHTLVAEVARLRSMPTAEEIRLAIQWWQAQDYDTEEGQQAAIDLANLLRRVAQVLAPHPR